ncbi:MAG: DinB family protein [Longimicrobiales bacterium]|nr:DinB family protein [Longimicrobiales bacterium]
MTDQSASSPSLVPELRECVEAIAGQTEHVRGLVEPLTEHQFSWRPDSERWSVGQNLSHLVLTNRSYLDSVEKALEEARAKGHLGEGPYRHGWLGKWFIRVLEPPPRMKVKTFSRLEPLESGSKEDVLREFQGVQDEARASMEAANGVDLGRARFPSPFLGALKFSVGQAYRIILAHNRRHFHQIQQILEDDGFPRA